MESKRCECGQRYELTRTNQHMNGKRHEYFEELTKELEEFKFKYDFTRLAVMKSSKRESLSKRIKKNYKAMWKWLNFMITVRKREKGIRHLKFSNISVNRLRELVNF